MMLDFDDPVPCFYFKAVRLISVSDSKLNLHLCISWEEIKTKHVSVINYAENEIPQSLPISPPH